MQLAKKNFSVQYFEYFSQAIKKLDITAINKIVFELNKIRKNNGRVFF